jgi:hypothetical protein
MIRKWQFLRRRPPCVQTHVVPNAIVKTQGSYRCEILRENVTADVPVSTKVRNSSFAGYGARTRRRRHDKLLRESRLQAPVRAGPLQPVLRAILLDQVPRGLQTSAGAQQGLLAMALQMSRAFGRRAKIIRRGCLNRRGLELSIACAGASGSYHDNGNSDDDRSLAGVGALASCVRLDHAGHSKHPWQIARLA